MSQLTPAELKKLEKLSKISIPKGKEEEYAKKLGKVVDFVGVLQSIDTEGVEPVSQVTDYKGGLREDTVKPSLSQEDVLKNSKHAYRGYFRVPKVIE